MIDAAGLASAGLRVDRAGDVLTVTLDRPARLNAQTPAMWAALAGIGASLPGDVRVIVLRGAGTAFSSGLDVSAFDTGIDGAARTSLAGLALMPEAAALELIASYQAAFTWWSRPDVISIAAVQGYAIGAGFQLALACDLRIAADDVQMSLPEATRGLVPDLGGTAALVRAVGYSRALEIAVTGRRVGAAEAYRLGLVNLVVQPAELDAAVSDCVAAVAAVDRNTATDLKSLLSGALGRTAQQQLAEEREAQLRRLKDGSGIGD
ncbi:MAG: enoyl-CoA hydratase/isomerase family protein [Actinomycetota bacterium]